MYIYIILMIVNFLFLFIRGNIVKFKNSTVALDRILVIIMVAFLAIIMGCRKTSVGVDTSVYALIYSKISNSTSLSFAIKQSSFLGPGYVLICWLLHYISVNPRIYIVFSACIMGVLLCKLANRQTDGTLFLFYWQTSYLFAFSMNGNRQVFSTLLMQEGIARINEKDRDIVGILMMIFGLSIHPVSISILLLFLFTKFFVNSCSYIKLFFISLGLAIGTNLGMKLFIKFVVFILPGYAKYVNGTLRMGFFNSVGGGRIIIFYMFLFFMMMLFVFYSNRCIQTNSLERCCLLSIFFFLTLGMLNPQNTSMYRMVMFVLPQGITILSKMRERIEGKNGIIMESAVCIVMFAYAMFNLLENESGVVPYELFI